MGLKLSVIVPVYNVEQFLPKCVESLLDQDLSPETYEIILVDDGSPDRCGEICDEYAARFFHIKVIHCENGGLGAARNSGIEKAQGKYVQFVDSDDFLEPNVLKILVEKMEEDQLDVLRFNYQNVNDRYEVFEPNKVSKPFVDFRDEVCDGLTFLTERLGFACYACQFMVRRDLLSNCHFKEGIYFEDTEWTPRILLQATRVTSTDLMVYNYLIRSGSITRSVEEEKQRKVVTNMMSLVDSLQQQKLNVKDQRWFEGMTAQLVLSLVSYVTIHCYEKKRDVICGLEKKNIFPLHNYHALRNNKLKINLLNISPYLLFYYLHFKKRNHASF